jgi:hypothetical protein
MTDARTRITEIRATLAYDRVVSEWGDEAPDVIALAARQLRAWYPIAAVSLNVGADEATAALVDNADLAEQDVMLLLDVDADVDAAYDAAVEAIVAGRVQ